jgi:hypothetical protein
MEFSVPTQADDFREQARAFFAEAYPDELRSRRFERPHDKEFFRAVLRWQREHLADRDAYETTSRRLHRQASNSRPTHPPG